MKLSGFDQTAMLQKQTAEDSWLCHVRFTEWCFQWSDAITRRTGRLTKTTRIMDLRSMSFRSMNRGFIARDGANAKATEDAYPQLLMGVYPCFPPTWIQAFWRLARPLMPKRFVEKVDIISPLTNPSDAKRLLRAISHADLPAAFGGELAQWPPPLGLDKAVF